MRTSRKLTQVILSLFALTLMSVAAMAADPGLRYPATSEVSDQKAGSILFYNIYTSSASGSNAQNARLNITNTSDTAAAAVHLFFVASGCAVADSYICLTPNQTASFLASDIDPGITGYMVAIATNASGVPTNFNWLIGDEYVKFSSGHTANLGAEAFAKLFAGPIDPFTNPAEGVINFDGANPVTATFTNASSYNKAPRTLAASSIASNLDGNSSLLIINRVGGSLVSGPNTTGVLFGVLYDDAEAGVSFQLGGNCQVSGILSNTFPRVAGTFNGVIGQGRTGWMRIWSSQGARGLLGAILTYNANSGSQPGAFSGGRNLHKLTIQESFDQYLVPIFPPNCIGVTTN